MLLPNGSGLSEVLLLGLQAPHPLAAESAARLRALPWVRDAAVRMRDMGQVFHLEAFVVATGDEIQACAPFRGSATPEPLFVREW